MNLQTHRWRMNRRTFLRGLGVSMALPAFEAMLPASARAAAARPPRMVAIYTPNGCNIHQWAPADDGAQYTLTPSLQPLAPVRGDVTVLGGLHHPGALNGTHNNEDNWLTGAPMGRGGFRNTISVDQLAAEIHGRQTRFPSLELSSLGGVGQIGHMNTLSWTRNGVPLPTEKDPRAVFERLFAPEPKSSLDARSRDIRRNTSVVDAVLASAKDLHRRLGSADQQKLDEYLAAVDEMERRLKRAEQWLRVPKAAVDGGPFTAATTAKKVPEGEVRNYLRLMYDLVVLAFQTDSTRVVTFSTGRESGGFSFGEIGIKENHHQLSHYNGDEEMLAKLAKCDAYLVEQFVHLIERLKSVQDGDAPLLDRTMLLYGSGMSINHSKYNLPMLLAGGAGLGLRHGQHLDLASRGEPIKKSDGRLSDYKVDPKRARISNVLLVMAQKMGVQAEKFADSTGTVSEIVKA